MDETTADTVFETVRRVAAAVERADDPDGVSIVQANGVAAGQAVFQAHVHVVPRDERGDVDLTWHGSAADESAQRPVATTLLGEL